MALELKGLGQFLPFAVVGHLQCAAVYLLQHIDGVALGLERGCQVFAAVVVDHLQRGRLAFVINLCGGDQPAEGVVLLGEIARQLAIEFLAWDGDILTIEVDSEVDAVFFIKKVRAKGLPAFLGDGR